MKLISNILRFYLIYTVPDSKEVKARRNLTRMSMLESHSLHPFPDLSHFPALK